MHTGLMAQAGFSVHVAFEFCAEVLPSSTMLLASFSTGPTEVAVTLQVSISGQALVFVVRTQGYSLFSRAGLLTYIAFSLAQVH